MSILAHYSTSTRGNITQNYHVEVLLVLSHIVSSRDVGGHSLAADVVDHNMLLERHHLVLVWWVGLLLA